MKMDISIFLKNISGMELVTMTFTRHSQMDGLYHENKSVTHIFIKYIIKYPFFAILKRKAIYVPYFWMLAIVRYCGWISKIISK